MTAIDTVAPARVRPVPKFFYFHMALVCMAIAVLGFLPSYWVPMATGTLKAAPVVHIHGLIFFCWSLYFVFQTRLAADGQVARHRAVGLIGMSLATAMLIFGVLISIQAMRETAAIGRPAVGENVALTSLTNIGLFAILVTAALANLRRPEWHKRLMLMAAISILGAPVARWLIYYAHMPRPPAGSDWIVCGLAVVPMLQDWRSRGRPHPAYWVAMGAMVAVRLVRDPVGQTAAWHHLAAWISGLAG